MLHFRSYHELDKSEGTVTLVDASHRLKTKADIVLIPQPSDDINDPLNWPKWRKTLAFATILVFASLSNWVIAGLGFAVPELLGLFQRDLNSISQGLIGSCVLTLGVGNFFWVPTALYFGKRPAFLCASLLFFASIIWSAKATSYANLVAARVVSAFAGSITEGLAAAINADLFFLHERGWWMGVYLIFLNLGPTLGSLISGFIIQGLGYKWHFWFLSILAGVDFLAIFFFLPETQYYRQYVIDSSQGSTDTKTTTEDTNNMAEDTKNKAEDSAEEVTSKKKSYLQELKPWSKINPTTSYFNLFIRPFPLIVYPAIFFAFLAFSTTLAWIVCVVDTTATVFQLPPYPYMMSPGVSGLINVPAFIGAIIGAFCGGALTDWIAERWARRNNGVFEPEYRLLALVIPFFLVPVGLLMYGCGIQHLDSWAVPWIGYGFLTFGLSSIPSIVMTYAIDCYYLVAFEALLVICGLKNIFSFGFSYGVVGWIQDSGYQGAFGEMVAIQTGVMLLAIPLWFWGKKLRHRSSSWKVVCW